MTFKALVILTSYGPDQGEPNGWFLPEFAHPHDVFVKAGVQLTVASPKGGVAPIAKDSVENYTDEVSVNFFKNEKSLWENTAKLEDIVGKTDSFDILFFPGGIGPMMDLVDNLDVQKIVGEFIAADKIIAAVCHGPAALLRVKVNGGTPYLAGKHVTAFPKSDEVRYGSDKYMPFILETAIRGFEGVKFEKAAEPLGEMVCVDGKLVTGQNPASAKGMAEAVIKILKDTA